MAGEHANRNSIKMIVHAGVLGSVGYRVGPVGSVQGDKESHDAGPLGLF